MPDKHQGTGTQYTIVQTDLENILKNNTNKFCQYFVISVVYTTHFYKYYQINRIFIFHWFCTPSDIKANTFFLLLESPTVQCSIP